MVIDAIVLAGGRSSRLDSVPKSGLRYGEQTLLTRAVAAVGVARYIVVVGEADAATLPSSVQMTREDPPFGGPAAGIAAGLAVLGGSSDFVIALACDMPHAGSAVAALIEQVEATTDGAIAVDGDRRQPLAAIYRTSSLAAAVAQAGDNLDGLSMFRLIASLSLAPISVPTGSTDDVDTWVDAARFGIAHSTQPRPRIETS
jgi:molybdopterin-guanine dinucleotide biosynthesis protein A